MNNCAAGVISINLEKIGYDFHLIKTDALIYDGRQCYTVFSMENERAGVPLIEQAVILTAFEYERLLMISEGTGADE